MSPPSPRRRATYRPRPLRGFPLDFSHLSLFRACLAHQWSCFSDRRPRAPCSALNACPPLTLTSIPSFVVASGERGAPARTYTRRPFIPISPSSHVISCTSHKYPISTYLLYKPSSSSHPRMHRRAYASIVCIFLVAARLGVRMCSHPSPLLGSAPPLPPNQLSAEIDQAKHDHRRYRDRPQDSPGVLVDSATSVSARILSRWRALAEPSRHGSVSTDCVPLTSHEPAHTTAHA